MMWISWNLLSFQRWNVFLRQGTEAASVSAYADTLAPATWGKMKDYEVATWHTDCHLGSWIEARADAKVISSAGSRAEAWCQSMSPFNVVSVYVNRCHGPVPKFIWLFDLRSSVCTLYTFARSSQQKTLLNSPLRLLQSIYLRVYVQICVICSRTLCLCKADKFKAPRYGATKDSGRCLKPVRGSSHL